MNSSKRILTLEFEEYDSYEYLSEYEKELIKQARNISNSAYAPYSDFYVGAVLSLEDGQIIAGNNQENAAYPSGLCAERVAIFYAGSKYPELKINYLVLSCNSKANEINQPLSPCGACRQVIAETELRQNKKIRIIMSGRTGKVLACNGIENLLPFMFKGEFVKRP